MFQALASRLGYRSTMSPKDGCWTVTVGERAWLSLRGANGAHDPVGTEHYEGVVWCPSVQSTFWLARRNGQPFITGNTWPEKICVRPIRSMCPRRVCVTCGEPSRRIVHAESAGLNTRKSRGSADDPRQTGAVASTDVPDYAERTTIGWTTCGCPDTGDLWLPGWEDAYRACLDSKTAERRRGITQADKTAQQRTTRKLFDDLAAMYIGRADGFHPGAGWRPGRVLDPFGGSGTTVAVAANEGRDAIGVDLDPKNTGLAHERVGLWFTETTVDELASLIPPTSSKEPAAT